MPLERSHVIHPGWSEYGATVAEGMLEDELDIRHPGGAPGAFDPVTGSQAATQHEPYWAGFGSVQVLPALDQERDVAGAQRKTLGYRVAIDRDAPIPKIGDVVTVVRPGPNSDPQLEARELVVRSHETGSAHWQRDLICTFTLG